jgi:hypothetical protein
MMPAGFEDLARPKNAVKETQRSRVLCVSVLGV